MGHQQHGGAGDVHVQCDGVQEDGRDQHFDAGRAVSRLTDPFTLKLNAPKNSDSPGWTKARRRKVPDGLVQRRILYFTQQTNISSEDSILPSGGPLKVNVGKSRGIKRGIDDQVEGPSGLLKRLREV